MFSLVRNVCLVIFLFSHTGLGADQPDFTLSSCGQPLTIAFSGTFNAYETACTQFRARSRLEIVNISFHFDDVEHTSSPADLDLTITSLVTQVAVHIGGWDDDARIAEDLEWPNEWQFSAEAGVYYAAMDVKDSFLDDDGVYELCVMNKWLNSGEAMYEGVIELQGMVSDCSLSSAPTITPEMLAASSGGDGSQCSGETGVEVAFDLTFTGKEQQCVPSFIAQGDLLALNMDVHFSAKQLYVGVVPVEQTMWPADLEVTLMQLSSASESAVVVGYDALDNEFSGDDDGIDNDSGSYFYGLSLNSSEGILDLMSAPLWLSPSTNLTGPMATNQESCDGEFCSMFTTNTFFSYGSADKNDFYPRYLHNLTAPFHLNSHILKNFACDDHFFMLSRKPEGSTFSYGIREDTITFAWDCKHKYIFTEGGATKRGEYCGKTGFYSVTVGIDAAGYAVFRDDICGEMKFKLEDPTGPWYLFIGSDNDNVDVSGNDDLNQNEVVSKGLNRYKLEWPISWATHADGDYTASILPKVHNFDDIGEYQLCLANSWGSYSLADLKGEVVLVGLQMCDDLVCAPGDRRYCSYNGECRTDGRGCICEDNRTFIPADRDVCASRNSNNDYFLGYSRSHALLGIGFISGVLVLLLMAVCVGVYKNNQDHAAHSKDVMVEAVDLSGSPQESQAPGNRRAGGFNLEIPPRREASRSPSPPPSGAVAGMDRDPRDVETGSRFDAYQVHKQSPLAASPSFKSKDGRNSPSREMKKFMSSNDVLTTKPVLRTQASVDEQEEDDDSIDETTSMISQEYAVAMVGGDSEDGVLLGAEDSGDEEDEAAPSFRPPSPPH